MAWFFSFEIDFDFITSAVLRLNKALYCTLRRSDFLKSIYTSFRERLLYTAGAKKYKYYQKAARPVGLGLKNTTASLKNL